MTKIENDHINQLNRTINRNKDWVKTATDIQLTRRLHNINETTCELVPTCFLYTETKNAFMTILTTIQNEIKNRNG